MMQHLDPPRRRLAPLSRSVLLLAALPAILAAAPPPGSARVTPTVRAIAKVRPCVVNIHSQKTATTVAMPGASGTVTGRMSGMGTGVIIDERGYIVTNHHVIEDVTSLRVTLADGTTYSAEAIARDAQTDLALLKVRPLGNLPVMPFGTSDDLMIGEPAIAIGNAFGYEHTSSEGIISELHRDVRLSEEQSYRNLIQTSAPINPGNSGGPLINADGQMIGLNVAIRAGAQNIGFAIPIDDVKQVLTKLMSVRRLRGTWHGLAVRTPEPAELDKLGGRHRVVNVKRVGDSHEAPETEAIGAIVRRVETGSPAEASGIKNGDRLLSLGGVKILAAYDVERALLDVSAGEKVAGTVERDGRERKINMTLVPVGGKVATAADVVWRRMGLRLDEQPVRQEIGQVSTDLHGGLRITEIAKDGPADRANIQVGDVLVGLDSFESLSLDNVAFVLKQPVSAGATPLKFYVVRKSKLHWGKISLLVDD